MREMLSGKAPLSLDLLCPLSHVAAPLTYSTLDFSFNSLMDGQYVHRYSRDGAAN